MFQVLRNVLNIPIVAPAQTAVSSQLGTSTLPKVPQLSASERLKSIEHEDLVSKSNTRNDRTEFEKRADKRKSRLGTSKHLSPKSEISDSEKELIYKDGYIYWLSPCRKPIGGKAINGGEKLYAKLQNGFLVMYEDEKAFYYNSNPLFQISVSNAFFYLNDTTNQLKISLVEDDETQLIRLDDLEELKIWMAFLQEVSVRWGAIQKTTLEHEIAGMRKQLGQLWEMCIDGTNPKVLKRINDLTTELQEKDSLMADVVNRQEELNVNRSQLRKGGKKVDLFPSEELYAHSEEILNSDGTDEESDCKSLHKENVIANANYEHNETNIEIEKKLNAESMSMSIIVTNEELSKKNTNNVAIERHNNDTHINQSNLFAPHKEIPPLVDQLNSNIPHQPGNKLVATSVSSVLKLKEVAEEQPLHNDISLKSKHSTEIPSLSSIHDPEEVKKEQLELHSADILQNDESLKLAFSSSSVLKSKEVIDKQPFQKDDSLKSKRAAIALSLSSVLKPKEVKEEQPLHNDDSLKVSTSISPFPEPKEVAEKQPLKNDDSLIAKTSQLARSLTSVIKPNEVTEEQPPQKDDSLKVEPVLSSVFKSKEVIEEQSERNSVGNLQNPDSSKFKEASVVGKKPPHALSLSSIPKSNEVTKQLPPQNNKSLNLKREALALSLSSVLKPKEVKEEQPVRNSADDLLNSDSKKAALVDKRPPHAPSLSSVHKSKKVTEEQPVRNSADNLLNSDSKKAALVDKRPTHAPSLSFVHKPKEVTEEQPERNSADDLQNNDSKNAALVDKRPTHAPSLSFVHKPKEVTEEQPERNSADDLLNSDSKKAALVDKRPTHAPSLSFVHKPKEVTEEQPERNSADDLQNNDSKKAALVDKRPKTPSISSVIKPNEEQPPQMDDSLKVAPALSSVFKSKEVIEEQSERISTDDPQNNDSFKFKKVVLVGKRPKTPSISSVIKPNEEQPPQMDDSLKVAPALSSVFKSKEVIEEQSERISTDDPQNNDSFKFKKVVLVGKRPKTPSISSVIKPNEEQPPQMDDSLKVAPALSSVFKSKEVIEEQSERISTDDPQNNDSFKFKKVVLVGKRPKTPSISFALKPNEEQPPQMDDSLKVAPALSSVFKSKEVIEEQSERISTDDPQNNDSFKFKKVVLVGKRPKTPSISSVIKPNEEQPPQMDDSLKVAPALSSVFKSKEVIEEQSERISTDDPQNNDSFKFKKVVLVGKRPKTPSISSVIKPNEEQPPQMDDSLKVAPALSSVFKSKEVIEEQSERISTDDPQNNDSFKFKKVVLVGKRPKTPSISFALKPNEEQPPQMDDSLKVAPALSSVFKSKEVIEEQSERISTDDPQNNDSFKFKKVVLVGKRPKTPSISFALKPNEEQPPQMDDSLKVAPALSSVLKPKEVKAEQSEQNSVENVQNSDSFKFKKAPFVGKNPTVAPLLYSALKPKDAIVASPEDESLKN